MLAGSQEGGIIALANYDTINTINEISINFYLWDYQINYFNVNSLSKWQNYYVTFGIWNVAAMQNCVHSQF